MSKRSCCVPHCGQIKSTNTSMHEFPTNVNLRKLWCKIIFNVSGFKFGNVLYVCSRHFSEENYIPNSKKLKADAVPTIFSSNPLPISSSLNSTNSIKIKLFVPEKNTNLDWVEKSSPESLSYSPTTNNESAVKPWRYTNGNESLCTLSLKEPLVSQDDFHCCNEQLNLLDEITNLKKELHLVKKNHAQLKKKHKMALENIFILKKHDTKLQTYVKKIETDATECKPLATFIMDQICNYSAKKATWSETTIRHCMSWRFSSPKGYEYARRTGIIKAPAKITLNRYIETCKTEREQ